MKCGPVAIVGLVGVSACVVSTQPGPLWPAQPLVGAAAPSYCVVSATVAIAGVNPALEQHARALWLEHIATRRDCRDADRRVSLDVADVQVRLQNAAFEPPATRDQIPTPATVQLTLSARALVTVCNDGERAVLPLEHVAWVAYTADPYLADERARAALDDLVARTVAQLENAIPSLACTQETQ